MIVIIKAIIMDLDDTLLRRDKTFSEVTLDTLKKCSAGGIKLIFATGRGTSSQKLVPYNLFDARVMYNGAIAEIDSETVYSQLIGPHLYCPFILEMGRLNLRAAAEIGGIHHANFNVSSMWERNFVISDFTDMTKSAEKLYVILNNSEDEEKINKKLPAELYAHFTKDSLALIMNKKATKVAALSCVLERMNITLDEVIAFGDDVNDKEMLEKCGTGVAMSNAGDEVKRVADAVCRDCDADGLANYLMAHIL